MTRRFGGRARVPRTLCVVLLDVLLPPVHAAAAAGLLDLRAATIVTASATPGGGERLAAEVLQDEVVKRTGVRWALADRWPAKGAVVAIATGDAAAVHGAPELDTLTGRPEAYRLRASQAGGRPVVWVVGADARGTLFGTGALLRALRWDAGRADLPEPFDQATAPRYPIRGHQLGYRAHSNTYDGWGDAQYDQYVRELVLLGANAIENIPFQDTRVSPLMPLPREELNRRLSAICRKYGIDYWLWTPADFDLGDEARRAAALDSLQDLFASLPRLDAVFVPGGDPGDNPADRVLPYLEAIAERLRRHHPGGTVWLSLQHFDVREIDLVLEWIDRTQPDWLGGLVAGPSSPPLPETRRRLNRRYRLRDYPDVAHTVRCQHPVPWWDPAFALTLGREPVNPRPLFYARVHDRLAPHTDGFISYSDGVNDDLNKAVWTAKAWNPEANVRDILTDYARLFFGARAADRAADALLALERNWDGPLETNGGVDATLTLWQALEHEMRQLSGNWRWQMHLMRAYYDAYTRHRLIAERRLEEEAIVALRRGASLGSVAATERALAALRRADTANCCPEWRQRIESLCEQLFAGIRMQTSVPRHSASGAERGAVLDFVDHPLNNRMWLEDQIELARSLPDEEARLARLERLAAWSQPDPGSFYDDVGNVSASPRVVRKGSGGGPAGDADDPIPHFTWEGGVSRKRLSWLTSLRWPAALVYEHLDPSARYEVRLQVITPDAPGRVRLRIDGTPASPSSSPRALGEPWAFDVAPGHVQDGRLVLTFDPVDESHLNWRQHSRLAEAWLIKR